MHRLSPFLNLMCPENLWKNLIDIQARCVLEYSRTMNRLQEFRTAAGMTQEEAAAALGWSQETVSGHERGRRTVDAPQLRAYARLYGCTADDILGDDPRGPVACRVPADGHRYATCPEHGAKQAFWEIREPANARCTRCGFSRTLAPLEIHHLTEDVLGALQALRRFSRTA